MGPMRFANKSALPRHERTHTGGDALRMLDVSQSVCPDGPRCPARADHTGEKPYARAPCSVLDFHARFADTARPCLGHGHRKMAAGMFM